MDTNKPMRHHRPLNTRGIVRGEVLAVIFALLVVAAIMAPVLRRTYQTSLTLRCRQQLHTIFAAIQSYAQSNGGYPPCQPVPPGKGLADSWREQIDPRLEPDTRLHRDGPSALWECPAGGGYVGNSKVFGPPHRTLGSYRLKLEIGVIADGKPAFDRDGVSDHRGIDWRHRDSANVMFLDGHVEWVPEAKGKLIRRHWDNPQ